jgi:hypothetical protein
MRGRRGRPTVRAGWGNVPDFVSMPTELPIACSLSAADMSVRAAEMGAIGGASLIGAEALDGRAVLRFRADAREKVAAIVAAEAECCPFLTMTLRDEPGAVMLEIEAPAGAEPVVQGIAAAFGYGPGITTASP